AIRIAARRRDVLTPACLVGFPIVMVCALFANVLLVYGFWAVCGLALARLNHLRRVEVPRQAYAPVAGGDPAWTDVSADAWAPGRSVAVFQPWLAAASR